MHEIGNSLLRCGKEVKSLTQVMLDEKAGIDEKTDALGLAVSNSLIMFRVNKLFVCGSALEDENFTGKLKAAVEKYMHGDVSLHIYDAKRAAFGAAIFAIEDYLCYIK